MTARPATTATVTASRLALVGTNSTLASRQDAIRSFPPRVLMLATAVTFFNVFRSRCHSVA
jgi:hypothetical protein